MKKLLIPILLLFSSINLTAQQTATELFHWEDTTLVGSNAYNNTYNECYKKLLKKNDYNSAEV